MARPTKYENTKMVNESFSLEPRLKTELKDFAYENRLSKSEVCREALEAFLSREKQRREQNSGR